jgi:hypothetical protein
MPRCLKCGREILAPLHPGTRYCSYRCKEQAYIARRRARDRPRSGGALVQEPDKRNQPVLPRDPLDDL